MLRSTLSGITPLEIIQLATFVGAFGATIILAIFCIHQHIKITVENQKLLFKVSDLTSIVRRNEWLLGVKGQCTIIWSTDGVRKTIELLGVLPSSTGAPEGRSDFLAFERWLTRESAAFLDNALMALHESGQSFDIVVETKIGATLGVEGFRSATYILSRFISLAGKKEENAQLKLENQNLKAEHDTLFNLLKKIPAPFWMQYPDGELKWVNEAYAEAVESSDTEITVQEKHELFGSATRKQMIRWFQHNHLFNQKLSTVVGRDRRIYSVTSYKGDDGFSGMAIDISDMEMSHQELERVNYDHAETLNRLTTAVAIFDSSQKLRFYNEAFRVLWQLEASFLDSAPDHALLLDRLRSEGKIAERPEWRRWKDSILSAYRSLELQEDWWHLPGGRTIRVMGSPQSNGGVTWMFENLTEKIDLESRYNAAIRVQGETLDNLVEGAAVFGLDGKLKLFNPAFLRLWNLESKAVAAETHITRIRDLCKNNVCEPVWDALLEAITGYEDCSPDRNGQTTLENGKILRYRLIPLPNGQKMITCVDVTDSVNIQRALKEKNEALERADRLKNDFIQHVSYELRSPLTNIMGFAELMIMPAVGRLNKKQKEYLKHISSSSSSLCAIVDDILDLATVDAGIMQLEYGSIDIKEELFGAKTRITEHMGSKDITVKIDMQNVPEKFFADQTRFRQILYNLLANSVNYASPSSIIELGCRCVEKNIEFFVHDDGPGIPDDVIETVFERFESSPIGGQRRGAGLGLAIVKSFVELHGGTVHIKTGAEKGTTVVCLFPLSPDAMISAEKMNAEL